MIYSRNTPNADVQLFIGTIERAFFTDLNAYITFDNRQVKTCAGIAYTASKRILIHSRHWTFRPEYMGQNRMLATIAHELGHVYHRWTQPDDYSRCTDYALELFADDFAAMCLGDMWKDEYRSNYKAYTGFATNRLTK